MSDCEKLLGGLSDYLDGNELSELCVELKKHMAGCTKCRLVVDSALKTIRLYKGEDLVEFPEDSRVRLHNSLRQAWKGRKGGNTSGQG